MTWRVFSTSSFNFFFFNDTATTEIYTLSLHDALPISTVRLPLAGGIEPVPARDLFKMLAPAPDRKSTPLNSSHTVKPHAGFCLQNKTVSRHLQSLTWEPLA